MTQPGRPLHWWQAVNRRTFNTGALAFTALLTMSGCKSEEESAADSLALQQEQGWNVGAKEQRLLLFNTVEQDATGSADWRAYSDPNRLLAAYKPRLETWQALFTPTLLQSLKDASLRGQMRLILTNDMREAFARGETLRRDLLSQVDKGQETFFIADLPGQQSVAFGAGMAGWADVIPGFDNWPHPNAVVPSHETLSALLYYAAYMEEHKKQLPDQAPGLLLLDSHRLAPYTEDGSKFDNRYLATVPSPEALKQRGVKNVMYIVPSRAQKQESDDLNDDFVAYKEAKINVVLLPLSDFQKVAEPITRTAPDGTPQKVTETRYYYGGGLGSHLGFLLLYSFLAPRPTLYYPPMGYGYGYPPSYPYGGGTTGGGAGGWRSTTLGDVRSPTTAPPSYQPQSRPTRFSGTRVGGDSGVGRTKPSGFGRTTVRTSGGRFSGIGSGRSGSLGRGGTGSS